MRLPNAALAIVEEMKVTEYLLSPDHPDGRSKAEFFQLITAHPVSAESGPKREWNE